MYLSVNAGIAANTPIIPVIPTKPEGITLTDAEKVVMDAVVELWDYDQKFKRAYYASARRVTRSEVSFTNEGHLLGMSTPELEIEFQGTTYTLLEGARAIRNYQREEYEAAVRAPSTRVTPPEVYQAQRWASFSKLERALYVAAHEATDTTEKAVIRRILETFKRTPDHTDAPAPAGVIF